MSSVSSERTDATTTAIEEALGRIGERISEGEATAEVCKCKEGMFALAATRRQLFGGAGFIAAVGMTTMLPRTGEAKAPPGAVEYPVPADSTKEQGRMMGVDGGYGSRSQFESEVRWANPTRTAAFTPLQSGYGIITPSGLHYERHHGGIPNIDPARHRLVLHGLVDRPIKYSLADLKSFPTVSRTYRQVPFRCAHRFRTERRSDPTGTRLSDAAVSPGVGRKHLDQMAAPPRGERQAVLHTRRDIEIYRPYHQDW